jgi:hypothetical protein
MLAMANKQNQTAQMPHILPKLKINTPPQAPVMEFQKEKERA